MCSPSRAMPALFLAMVVDCVPLNAHPWAGHGDGRLTEVASSPQDSVLGWQFVQIWAVSGSGADGILLSEVIPSDLAVIPDGRIAVLDRLGRRVYVIGPDGAVLDSLGRHGAGPGEFSRAAGVTVDGEGNIAVFDHMKNAFVRWSREDGVPLSEMRVQGTLMGGETAFAAGGIIYKTLERLADGSDVYQLHVASGEGVDVLARSPNLEARAAEFPSCGFEFIVRPLFTHTLPWTARGERIVAVPGTSYRVWMWDRHRREADITRQVEPRPVTRRMALREFEDYTMLNCRVPAEEALRGMGYADSLPAVVAVRMSPTHELWLRRGVLRGEEERTDVFSPDGRYLGTLVDAPFPAAFLDRDRILTISTDALDVSTISALEIVRTDGAR